MKNPFNPPTKKSLFGSFFVFVVFSFFLSVHFLYAQTNCTLYNSSTAVPYGFGASYDLFSSAKNLLMNVVCSGNFASFTAGDGSQNTLIYKKGYTYNGIAWNEVLLTGTEAPDAPSYIIGTAKGTFPILSGTNYAITYICQNVNNAWKCGCSDSSCSAGHWNLQAYKKTSPTPTIPTNPTGGTGGLEYWGNIKMQRTAWAPPGPLEYKKVLNCYTSKNSCESAKTEGTCLKLYSGDPCPNDIYPNDIFPINFSLTFSNPGSSYAVNDYKNTNLGGGTWGCYSSLAACNAWKLVGTCWQPKQKVNYLACPAYAKQYGN